MYDARLIRFRVPVFGSGCQYQNGLESTERFADGTEVIKYPNGDVAIEYRRKPNTNIGKQPSPDGKFS